MSYISHNRRIPPTPKTLTRFRYRKLRLLKLTRVHFPPDVAKVSANRMSILIWGHVPAVILLEKGNTVVGRARGPNLPWLSPRR